MAIRHINGKRLRSAILAGAQRVLEYQEQLNRINVFPVPDGDTGTNMALTMRFAAEGVLNQVSDKLPQVCGSLRRGVLDGARGNSGAILAQFFQAFATHLAGAPRAGALQLAQAFQQAVERARQAIGEPREGTILTVMQRWSEYWSSQASKQACLLGLLKGSLEAARNALSQTPTQLPQLARAGVVDAGAQGFVALLEGIQHFSETGHLDWRPGPSEDQSRGESSLGDIPINYTYCTEASVRGTNLSPEQLREAVAHLGDSLIVAGEGDYVRLHIHTDQPQLVFRTLEGFGSIERTKAENMREQYARHLAEKGSSSLALVVDSSCDLPVETLLLNQIRVVPVRINHGEKSYLDRVEITPESVYRQMSEGARLQTSQPAASSFSTAFAAALAHHDQVLALTLSSGLSGTFQAAQTAAAPLAGKVQVFDTKSGAGGHGLLVRQALKAMKRGDDLQTILQLLQRQAPHTQLIVCLETIDYAQRSGRLPWYKAGLARLLGRVPLLALEQGRIVSAGVAPRGEARIDFLVKTVLNRAKGLGPLDLIISHADEATKAHVVAERLQHLAREPIPILAISPTVGVHVGPGTVAVAFLPEALPPEERDAAEERVP